MAIDDYTILRPLANVEPLSCYSKTISQIEFILEKVSWGENNMLHVIIG